jgi:hypothetical protein
MPVLWRLSVASPLPPEEAAARVAAAVGPPDHTNPGAAGYEFLGTAAGAEFRCRRFIRSWSRIVAPDVVGRIVPAGAGSRIDVALRPRPHLLLVLALPLVPVLRGQITERDARVLLPVAFGLVAALTAASLWWEVVKARRFLERIAGGAARPALVRS